MDDFFSPPAFPFYANTKAFKSFLTNYEIGGFCLQVLLRDYYYKAIRCTECQGEQESSAWA